MRLRAHNQGFSLIELLVVIAIISILFALLMPTLSKAIRKARGTAAMAETRDDAMGRTADDAMSPPAATRPTLKECRRAFYQARESGDGERYYTTPLCVVRNDDEFSAYWHTTINAAASEEPKFDDAGNLIAEDARGRRYLLPVVPESEFFQYYGVYPIAWEFMPTNLANSSSGDRGTHVLYSDGHTEYKPYGSTFPASRSVAEFSQLFLDTR